MTNVVYFLGAGFSAPLGLPLVSNFIDKSKDLFAENATRYGYFQEIFNFIRENGITVNRYKADFDNIEEILSIMQMKDDLGVGSSESKSMQDYISDVVNRYTPELKEPSNAEDQPLQGGKDQIMRIFGAGPLLPAYGYFVASLLNLKFVTKKTPDADQKFQVHASIEQEKVSYSIITVNYDMVLETFGAFLQTHFMDQGTPDFFSPDSVLPLAKLHGSANKKEILVAPTWNKSLTTTILPAWKLAYNLLSKAHYIRMIGYSLPLADSYIQYLFKAAAKDSDNLKWFDVICLDDKDSTVKRRYESFFRSRLRFYGIDTESYLHHILSNSPVERIDTEDETGYSLNGSIEPAHEIFMKGR